MLTRPRNVTDPRPRHPAADASTSDAAHASSASTSAPAAPGPACSTPAAAMLGAAKRDIAPLRTSRATSSSSRATTSGRPSATACARRVGAAGDRPGRGRRHRLRRDLLAGRARRGRRAAAGRPVARTRPATSSSGWTIAPSSRPSASTPPAHDVLAMSAARSRRRWRRRSCSGCARTCPAVFDAAWQFFDLTDFLTWRATGSLARSTCTVTCKWTYLAHERRWDASYFRAIGLGVLADEGFARIGTRDRRRRHRRSAAGLTEAAAAELGLARRHRGRAPA